MRRLYSVGAASASFAHCVGNRDQPNESMHSTTLVNWSGTHCFETSVLHEPESEKQVFELLRRYNKKGAKLRPVGTSLSPNGLGFNANGEAAITLQNMNKIVVDPGNKVVTVGAGTRISDILQALKPYGLTLENFSSITEQQAAGWTQVAAHGTGASLSTVEEQIVSMRVLTPSGDSLCLSSEQSPHLFRIARASLGTLGIVTSLTMRCVPSLVLHENMRVLERGSAHIGHRERLSRFRHVRYMWLPYTNDVVCVTSNPSTRPSHSFDITRDDATKPLSNLLLSLSPSTAASQSFSELRDALLSLDPLNTQHVAAVNQAEAQFWRNATAISDRSDGRVDDSSAILGFDCGGQQLVLEVCFPCGHLTDSDVTPNRDIEFVKELLVAIETNDIPAPCPIEQRWSARSTSPLSPAYHPTDPDMVYCWVGIIMYLGNETGESERSRIISSFKKYSSILLNIGEKYSACPHWAKLEVPDDKNEIKKLQMRLKQRYGEGIDDINHLRKRACGLRNIFSNDACDPKNILSNEYIDTIFSTNCDAN